MNRQEKEEYLISNCHKYGFRKDTKGFREQTAKLSDSILDTKIESLNSLIEDALNNSELVEEDIKSCKVCGGAWYEEKIEVRTTSADDTVCEKIRQDNCNGCCGCSSENHSFVVTLYNGNCLQLEYKHNIEDLVTDKISEVKRIKYCFECGRKL